MSFTRYAVYYTPPPGAFADLGVAWLGWDSARGQPLCAPDLPDLPAPPHEITATPRRYGLHATIVPPFRLATGQTEAALHDALIELCDDAAPAILDGLEIAAMGRFLALVPDGATDPIDSLAERAVRALHPFRAPLDDAELARRRTPALTPEQDANLTRWGYPYVMSAFRFHITLTGKRPKTELPAIRRGIERYLVHAVPRPFAVDALSLMGEDTHGRFHVIRRQPLSGPA
jgi:hypothetical protein